MGAGLLPPTGRLGDTDAFTSLAKSKTNGSAAGERDQF